MKKSIFSLIILANVLIFPVYANEVSNQYFFEIGTSFGGDEIAVNNNGGLGGDNYKAGGGAILGLGIKKTLSGNIKAQGLVAYRYQGGDGSNSGVVLEGAALYQFNKNISAGLGLHADLTSKTNTPGGNTIKFNNAVGPMILVDWTIDTKLAIGLKYIAIDYETSEGIDFEGNQAVVYAHYKF